MARITLEQAYPELAFRPSSRNWWAWLKGLPAECVHLDQEEAWMATLVPDTLYLRGKAAKRREPTRPEISLCRECMLGVIGDELDRYPGRVVAFEPDEKAFTQYFFVGVADFTAAGLAPGVAAAIAQRLESDGSRCAECSRAATWLWFSGQDVTSLDDVAAIGAAPGERLCAAHGARKLCATLEAIAEVNLFYMNLPYGDSGAFVWI